MPRCQPNLHLIFLHLHNFRKDNIKLQSQKNIENSFVIQTLIRYVINKILWIVEIRLFAVHIFTVPLFFRFLSHFNGFRNDALQLLFSAAIYGQFVL